MIGIYKITNKNSQKSYIGQSIHCGRRLEEHYGGHSSNFIDDIIQIEGVENFTFEILKEVEKEELSYWEDYYIIKYNTIFPNGYNKKWNTSEELRESIKVKVDQDLLKEKNQFSSQSSNFYSEFDVMYYFNDSLFELYLRVFYLSHYDSKRDKYIVDNRIINGLNLQKYFPSITYNTLMKYLRELKKTGIIEKDKSFSYVKKIPVITDQISEDELNRATTTVIFLWYVKYKILIDKNNTFFSMNFRWVYSMNTMGAYHSGIQNVKSRKSLAELEQKGCIKITSKSSDYKFVISLL